MRKNMMLFQIAEGLLGTVLCMSLGWILLEKVFLVPYGSMILWILSPALFLRCIQSVFLGYFQSEGSEMPSAVSSVLRQVFGPGSGVPGDFPELRGESKSFIKKGRLYIHVRSHGYRSGNAAFGGVGTAICLCDLPWQHGRQKRSGKRYEGNGLFLLAAAYITDSYGWGYSQRHVFITAFVDRPAFLPEKIDGYLCIRFCVWYFRRQISDHDPDARSNFKCGNSAGGGQNRQPYP